MAISHRAGGLASQDRIRVNKQMHYRMPEPLSGREPNYTASQDTLPEVNTGSKAASALSYRNYNSGPGPMRRKVQHHAWVSDTTNVNRLGRSIKVATKEGVSDVQ